MKFRSRKSISYARIELAPLIDVIAFIVIYFLMNATLQKQTSIKIELPRSSNQSKSEQKKEKLTININKEGKIFFLDEKIPTKIDKLVEKLNFFLGPKEKRKKKDNQVIIRSDGSTNYKSVIQVIDKINEAGISKFSLATIREKK